MSGMGEGSCEVMIPEFEVKTLLTGGKFVRYLDAKKIIYIYIYISFNKFEPKFSELKMFHCNKLKYWDNYK